MVFIKKFSIFGALALVVLAVIFFARNDEQTSENASDRNKTVQQSTESVSEGETEIASSGALTRAEDKPGESSVLNVSSAPADNYRDLLASYSEVDQKIIANFNENNFSALEFNSPEEYQWMVANGYPTPEDVIAASNLSLYELMRNASSGDVVAINLAASALLDEMLKEAKASKARGFGPFENNEAMGYMTESYAYLTDALNAGSPFAAYLLARNRMNSVTMHGRGTEDEMRGAADVAIRGLILADSMGDPNAARHARRIADSAGLPAETVAHYQRYADFLNSVAFEGSCSGIFADRPAPSGYTSTDGESN